MNNESNNSDFLSNKIILDYMEEKKRQRKWRIFKWILFFGILVLLVSQFNSTRNGIFNELEGFKTEPHVGLIEISGTIADAESESGSADVFSESMADAYKSKGLMAVVLKINSPGGSPVQADYMYNTIKYYRNKFPSIKVYAVCVDTCASAAYYIAAAADEIYANPASVVGSIGVLYDGFGFVDLMHKMGVTRRLHTAGINKGSLDPFSPETPQQTERLQVILDLVHKQFIEKVKEGRGSRLQPNEEMFTGLFWTGEQAKALGLIDGFYSAGQVARDKLGIQNIVEYTHKETLLGRMTRELGASIADQLPTALGIKPGFK